jgi:DNA polymerase elongation subunit (family B)
MYTYCIKELGGPIIKRAISLNDLHRGVFDRELLKQFIEDVKKFDRLIFHYGENRRFDLPFLRTRAEYWELPFPTYGALYVSDTWPILRNRFRLHSNRLEAACDFFEIPSKKHKLNPRIWLAMMTGNKKKMAAAIQYILKHNQEDVYSLERLWVKISKYMKIGKTSV